MKGLWTTRAKILVLFLFYFFNQSQQKRSKLAKLIFKRWRWRTLEDIYGQIYENLSCFQDFDFASFYCYSHLFFFLSVYFEM